jgi:hypothetical protein
VTNNDLVEGDGKVHIDEAQSVVGQGQGKGIIADIERTVGTHWVDVQQRRRSWCSAAVVV